MDSPVPDVDPVIQWDQLAKIDQDYKPTEDDPNSIKFGPIPLSLPTEEQETVDVNLSLLTSIQTDDANNVESYRLTWTMTPSADAKDELVDFDFYWMMSCFECETTEVFLLRSEGFDGDNQSDRFYIGHQRANVTIDVLLNGNDHYIVEEAFQEVAFTWLPEDGQTGAEEV